MRWRVETCPSYRLPCRPRPRHRHPARRRRRPGFHRHYPRPCLSCRRRRRRRRCRRRCRRWACRSPCRRRHPRPTEVTERGRSDLIHFGCHYALPLCFLRHQPIGKLQFQRKLQHRHHHQHRRRRKGNQLSSQSPGKLQFQRKRQHRHHHQHRCRRKGDQLSSQSQAQSRAQGGAHIQAHRASRNPVVPAIQQACQWIGLHTSVQPQYLLSQRFHSASWVSAWVSWDAAASKLRHRATAAHLHLGQALSSQQCKVST